MEKITRHKDIVHQLFEEMLNKRTSLIDITTHYIKDEEHMHFQLMNDGWRDLKRFYGCFLHVQVKQDGKVWIHHDGTDLGIAQFLVQRGIPKEDIVLGFQAPYKRKYTGFAEA